MCSLVCPSNYEMSRRSTEIELELMHPDVKGPDGCTTVKLPEVPDMRRVLYWRDKVTAHDFFESIKAARLQTRSIIRFPNHLSTLVKDFMWSWQESKNMKLCSHRFLSEMTCEYKSDRQQEDIKHNSAIKSLHRDFGVLKDKAQCIRVHKSNKPVLSAVFHCKPQGVILRVESEVIHMTEHHES